MPYDGPEGPAPVATPSPVAVASAPRTPPPSPTPTPGVDRVPSRRLPALATPGLAAEPTRTAARTPVVIEGTERPSAPPPAAARSETKPPVRSARTEPVPPAAPIANRAGTFSLARQLGLSRAGAS